MLMLMLITCCFQTPQGLFDINQADGEVTLTGNLDYEHEKFYQLELMASVSVNVHS